MKKLIYFFSLLFFLSCSKQEQKDSLKLKQKLVFSYGHKAIIKNISKSTQQIKFHFKNKSLLADGLTFSSEENKLTINSSKTDAVGHVIFPNDVIINSTDSTYVFDKINIKLKPNEAKGFTISQAFIFKEYSWGDELKSIQNTTFKTVLDSRKTEKNAELKLLIENIKSQFLENIYAKVLAKENLTLQNNWRIPAGEIKHEGLFPSYYYK